MKLLPLIGVAALTWWITYEEMTRRAQARYQAGLITGASLSRQDALAMVGRLRRASRPRVGEWLREGRMRSAGTWTGTVPPGEWALDDQRFR